MNKSWICFLFKHDGRWYFSKQGAYWECKRCGKVLKSISVQHIYLGD